MPAKGSDDSFRATLVMNKKLLPSVMAKLMLEKLALVLAAHGRD